MDGHAIRTLAQYIAEHQRRNRYNYGTAVSSAVDTTLENNSTGDEGDRSRDGRLDQDHSRQSWD